MTETALPSSPSHRFRFIGLTALIPIVGILAAVDYFGPGYVLKKKQVDPTPTAQLHTVQLMDLEIKIAKDGELQAVNNIDVICEVEGSTTIQELVKEGTSVKKGDILCVLDSSAIKQKIEDTSLDLQKAIADLTTAKELRDIQQSQNAANLEAAQVALVLAKLDLQQYVEGSYPQQLKNAETDVEMAQITLKNKEEDLETTRNLFSRAFVTAADVKKAELEVTNAKNALDKAATALAVLSKYTHEMDLASKKNALAQAEQKLIRTQKENSSNLSQKEADVNAKAQAWELLKRRMERFQVQLTNCTIKAPAEGLVVYATSGDRNAEKAMQEGAQVRERQLLFRLPDTAEMKATVRIPESQVRSLSEGMPAMVKLSSGNELIEAYISKISVLVDNNQRWWNPDLKEYPVELTLERTPMGLKPSMAVSVEILLNRFEQTVAVPLPAIYSAGADAYVFAPNGESYTPVKVKLGATTSTFAQVKDGLEPGRSLLLLQSGQGRQLLEQAGIKPAPPTTQGTGKGGNRPDRKARGTDKSAVEKTTEKTL